MKSTLSVVVVFFCVQLAVGVLLIGQLFANNGDNFTIHWEIVPREKTTKHWEIPDILPRDQNQDSSKNSEILLTEEPPFEGGDGTVPSGAVNDGGLKEVSMVPYELVEGSGSLPPGALNDGEMKEISMVPYELEDSKGKIPPGALNEENDHKIPPTNVPEDPWTTNVSGGPWISGQGTPPPGAFNDGSSNPFMRGARFLLRAFGF